MPEPELQRRIEMYVCGLNLERKIHQMGNSSMIGKIFYKVLEEKKKDLGNIHCISILQTRTLNLRGQIIYSTSHQEEAADSIWKQNCLSLGVVAPLRVASRTKTRTVYVRGSNHQQDGSSEKKGSLLVGVNPKVLWEETLFGQLPTILITRL